MSAIIVALIGAAVYSVVTSPNVRLNRTADYLFDPQVLSGVGVTIVLTVACMVLGAALGVLAAFAHLSPIRAIRWLAIGYVGIFRGVPLLVQILFMFNVSLFIPTVGFGDWTVPTSDLMSPIAAALAALSLYTGAYMAEIVRGGIQSVSRGQMEAALSLGMTRFGAMRRIIIPQALPAILPATGNHGIIMLKSTSLVVVIGAQDLLTEVTLIYTRNYLIVELLLVASFWYLLLVTLASVGQYLLEARFQHQGEKSGTMSVGARRVLSLVLSPFGGRRRG